VKFWRALAWEVIAYVLIAIPLWFLVGIGPSWSWTSVTSFAAVVAVLAVSTALKLRGKLNRWGQPETKTEERR
jgi:Kef-type K+ transport system membrane component KefB